MVIAVSLLKSAFYFYFNFSPFRLFRSVYQLSSMLMSRVRCVPPNWSLKLHEPECRIVYHHPFSKILLNFTLSPVLLKSGFWFQIKYFYYTSALQSTLALDQKISHCFCLFNRFWSIATRIVPNVSPAPQLGHI